MYKMMHLKILYIDIVHERIIILLFIQRQHIETIEFWNCFTKSTKCSWRCLQKAETLRQDVFYSAGMISQVIPYVMPLLDLLNKRPQLKTKMKNTFKLKSSLL